MEGEEMCYWPLLRVELMNGYGKNFYHEPESFLGVLVESMEVFFEA